MRMRRLIALVLALGLGLGAAACGKKGDVEPPEGAETNFPRAYPR